MTAVLFPNAFSFLNDYHCFVTIKEIIPVLNNLCTKHCTMYAMKVDKQP